MLVWKPQRVQLFPGDDMKPIELQEMVIGSYLWKKRAGSERNRNHCEGSFCLQKSPSSFHNIRLSTECGREKGVWKSWHFLILISSLPLLWAWPLGTDGCVKQEHTQLWRVGEAGMSPVVLLSTSSPGNQQPLSRAKHVGCRDERELITCLGAGEMAVLGE